MSSFQLPRRRFFHQSAGALAAAGAFGITPSQAASAPIRIALPSPGTAGSVWQPMIERLGALGGTGLPPLEWTVSDPGRMQVQLTAGSLDVGFFGPVGLATLRARGQDILLFGPGTTNHSVWLVKDNSPYKKPADLKGRRVATQPETAETYQQARLVASLAGLDLKKDFQVMLGSPLANVALFERGDVDAVIVLEPTATRLIANGAREIGRVGTMWREATGDTADPFLVGLAAQRTWIEQNRATATRLAQLFAKANAQIVSKPNVLREIHTAIGLRETEQKALELVPQRLSVAYSTTWDASVWRGIDRQLDVAASVGLLAQRPTQPIYDGVALAAV